MRQITDVALLEGIISKLIAENEDIVNSYKAGKEKAFQALVGSVMRQTKGKASPSLTAKILSELITK